MQEDVIQEIIDLCLLAEEKAAKAYRVLSENSEDEKLAGFWKEMCRQEMKHLGYWKRLSAFSKECMLPPMFDRPYTVKEDLESAISKVDRLLAQCEQKPTVTNSFILAYRLEFYLLHPAVVTMFHFLSTVPGEPSPEDDYEEHLNSFIEALRDHGSVTPELELLSETITRLWQENRELVVKSNTDDLTGVLNRRGLFKALRPLAYLAQRTEIKAGVLIIDIDDFKEVNDHHGHQKGDEVIAMVARVLAENVRASDVVGRYGGEEFLVFLPDIDMKSLAAVGEKLRSKVEEKTSDLVRVTVSVGAAVSDFSREVETDLDGLVKAADENMYRAKLAGKNRVEGRPAPELVE